MASTPPASPSPIPQRPASTIFTKPPRSMSSRLSISTKGGIGSRASDEDGRTAVRVAVRIRPPLKPSDPGFDLIPQRFQRSMVQTTSDTSLSIDSPQGRKLFVFDRVFGPDVQQDGIWDYLADSIASFTEGYNVSLLAYGQSGAGKSYTMGTSGPLEQQDSGEMGVVPRAATALFEKLDAMYGPATAPSLRGSISMSSFKNPRGYGQRDALGDRNWSLKATYVEIYNEQLRDLLADNGAGDRSSVAIREDTKGNILLTGLRQVDINSVDDLMNALNVGSTIRQTDSTAINAKSSRSHAVFSLNLVQRKSKLQTNGANKRHSMPVEALTGQEMSITTDSKLHFVDLAGSERLKNTGAQGERAKEGISINAGLASLGKVISQLSSRQSGSYVSYRDSKLTRLLQDSLGGNAITYMIACVTPPEFHLSETLNTVQYAQRARAIQSKPQIQQVEDSDKQAVIDRLKAEVSFLREQIRSAQNAVSSPRADGPGGERSQRQNERESELQNQLLDMQENYSALSNRHARLIAEMAKAGDESKGDSTTVNGDSGVNDATDRLNRSNSFAQAVEAVVLEYEKTIESLEHSLSSTRTTLSNTETNLLERESKCAYIETINGQLQSRIQKLMDRESSTEHYLHDLEAKLDGHTSGDEKNATIIIELRKEIARIRENEAACEDYISTLEERLAEADQDQELMQREVDRLEQVVERQRSLGKLDSLLHELDNVEEIKQPEPESSVPVRRAADHSRNLSMVSRHSQVEETIPEDDEEALRPASRTSTIKEQPSEEQPEAEVEPEGTVTPVVHAKVNGHTPADSVEIANPAQSKHVADKLESVTGELVNLRVEHETTLTRYDALQLKYEEAMRKMSRLQDTIDESRHAATNPRDSVLSVTTHEAASRPDSFQSDQDNIGTKDGARSSASRSLSSELSSAMESTDTADTEADTEHELETEPATDISEDDAATTKPTISSEDLHQTTYKELSAEVERLKMLADEKESAAKDLADRYTKLESEHSEALDTVEELKTNLSKARAVEAVSPKASSQLIRRKSSQNLLMDRAHRSFASLRNIASENFEGRPDVMQNFELNINAAMHELHQRSERIQELEASVAATKKEMDTKMTIISGLTRERTSLKASPMDITMVATLRDKLEQHEKQLMDMKEEHTTREQKLMDELETLREASKAASPEPEAMEKSVEQGKDIETHEKTLADLRAELSGWELKHQEILDSMRSADADSRQTVERLEGDLVSANKSLDEARLTASMSQKSILDLEKKHQDLVSFLRSEIDEYKGMINSNTTKVADLEKEHANTKSELAAMTTAHATATEEASTHKALVEELQAKIATHEETTKAHQQALDELQTTHSKALSEAKELEQKGYEEQVEVLLTEHAETIRKLETETADAREDLLKVATQVATVLGVEVSIEKLTERIDSLARDRKALVAEQESNKEMSNHLSELSSINEKVVEELNSTKIALAELANAAPGAAPALIADHVATIKDKVAELESRNEKSSRLVEELEEQLQHNFDEVQVASKRLSNLQSERTAQLEEADAARAKLQADLDTIREEHSTLQARLQEVEAASIPRSDSQSTIRKSASHNSLPSPPPAIPLPPLPLSPTGTRPMSRDNLNITQITEDQEARIRTIEKHLYAERQLTQTLEEALSDLEKQSKKVKSDCDAWKKRAQELEGEVQELKDSTPSQEAAAKEHRWSMLQVEEERKKRVAAEAARKQLEERMNAINKGKKKKGSLNCF